jgi:hypothetical protein
VQCHEANLVPRNVKKLEQFAREWIEFRVRICGMIDAAS